MACIVVVKEQDNRKSSLTFFPFLVSPKFSKNDGSKTMAARARNKKSSRFLVMNQHVKITSDTSPQLKKYSFYSPLHIQQKNPSKPPNRAIRLQISTFSILQTLHHPLALHPHHRLMTFRGAKACPVHAESILAFRIPKHLEAPTQLLSAHKVSGPRLEKISDRKISDSRHRDIFIEER